MHCWKVLARTLGVVHYWANVLDTRICAVTFTTRDIPWFFKSLEQDGKELLVFLLAQVLFHTKFNPYD